MSSLRRPRNGKLFVHFTGRRLVSIEGLADGCNGLLEWEGALGIFCDGTLTTSFKKVVFGSIHHFELAAKDKSTFVAGISQKH